MVGGETRLMAAYTLGRDSEDILAWGRGDVAAGRPAVCVPHSAHTVCAEGQDWLRDLFQNLCRVCVKIEEV